MKCKGGDPIRNIYILNPKDLVIDKDGTILRMKRKYGNYDRKVTVIKKGESN
jgi:hypothetical protein